MNRIHIVISLQITVDIRLRYALPKLPPATSFIRKTLGEIERR